MMYTLYHYNSQFDQWGIHCRFEDQASLIRFLACGTNTYGFQDHHRWSNRYFDGQNLTGKDTTAHSDWRLARDDNGDCKMGKYGPVYEHVYYQTLREWWLCDSDGRTVDMAMFKDEVFNLAEELSHYKYPSLYLYAKASTQTKKKIRQRQGRAYHHSCHFRCSPKNHRYGRTLKTVEEFDDDAEMMLTSHQAQAMKVKPKDMYAKYCWGDDFWTRGPSGWKEHKNSRQWEAKQKRNAKRCDDAVWVSSENKRATAVEIEEFDEFDYENRRIR